MLHIPVPSNAAERMAPRTPSVPAQRLGWGPPNSDVLGPDVLSLPQTWDDLGNETRKDFVDELLDDLRMLLRPRAWDNAKLLSGVRWIRQLDSRLPPPSPGDHPVYLVTVPRGHTRYRFGHWSLYSQG
jgi:hypothetical protein